MRKKNICGFISGLLAVSLLLSGCENNIQLNFDSSGQSSDSAASQSSASASTSEAESEPSSEPATAESSDASEPELFKEYEYEYVRATLKGNELTVTILSGDSADKSFGTSGGLRYDEPYPVTGVTGSYTDVFVGSIGNSIMPYIFLLTEQGTVECVTVADNLIKWETGNRAGDPEFTDIGELPGVNNVVSFYAGTAMDDDIGYGTVFAVTAEGNEIDLSTPCYFAINPQIAPPGDEAAIEILVGNAQAIGLEDLLGRGMIMKGIGGTEYIDEEYCSLIAVGTDSEESFVQEQLFAVSSSGAVYKFDAAADKWTASNKLAEIYSNNNDFWNLFSIICEPNGNELDEINPVGSLEEVDVTGFIHSDTPMILLPLKNNVRIKVEQIEFTDEGVVKSDDVLADLTLNKGDLCAVYTKIMYDTSPLFIFATWQDGEEEYNAGWWAVGGGGEYGETYIEYISASGTDSGDSTDGPMG